MFGCFSEDVRRILIGAKEEMYMLNHPYVGSEHFVLSLLKNDNDLANRLNEYNLSYDNFKNELIKVVGTGSKKSEYFLYTPLLKRVLENSLAISKDYNASLILPIHVFLGLLEEGDGVALRIISLMGIDIDKIYDDFIYKQTPKLKNNAKLMIDEIGIDLTKKALENGVDPVIGRNNEISRILEILLRRSKNNPILIGSAGVGKTAIVEELARLISIGSVPKYLKNKRIISVDMSSLVAGTKYRGEFEDRINKLIKELENNDDIILFIDEIHTLVGAGGAEGAIDASNIFKPALARNKIRVIGATTTDEYKKYVEKDSALDRRFQKVLVEEPNAQATKDILMGLKPLYEKFHGVCLSDTIIDKIVYYSNKYIYDRNQPDKAIDLMDEVCAFVNINNTLYSKDYDYIYNKCQETKNNKSSAIKNGDFKLAKKLKKEENKLLNQLNNMDLDFTNEIKKSITLNDIANVINNKTHIPVYEILSSLSNLDNDYKDIVGQNNVKNRLNLIKKKIKLGYKNSYSIMFAGSSGVGKTSMAKLFGHDLVGDNVIKLDASEFMEPSSINKFLGAPPGYVGYEDNKSILEDIRNKPNSVLIVDEVEKAHPSIINLFLQILDDKKIKDNKGNIIHFDNIVIIFTSNVGFNTNVVGFNDCNNGAKLEELKNHFSVPFINRLDEIILFDDLKEDDIIKLIKYKVDSLINKYKDKIIVSYDDKILSDILSETCYKTFGARSVDKIISKEIESIIIENIIKNCENVNINSLHEVVIN